MRGSRQQGLRVAPMLIAAAIAAIAAIVAVTPGAHALPAAYDPEPEVSHYSPPASPALELSLEEALSLAIQHDPDMYLAREQTRAERGRLVESSGQFDTSFKLESILELESTRLTSGEREFEEAKRKILRVVARQIQCIADALRNQLVAAGELELIFPNFPADCPAGEADTTQIIIDGIAILPSPAEQQDEQRTMFFARALNDAELQQALIDTNRVLIDRLIEQFDELAAKLRNNLRQFGIVPKYQDTRTLTLDLTLTRPLRNGMIFHPGLKLTATQGSYRGKRTAVAWGGKGAPTTVKSIASLNLDVPLRKGRGAVSAGATERAAQVNHAASLNTQAQTAAQTALKTCLAYWRLVSVQDRLAVQEQSAANARRFVEIGEQLVAGEQIVEREIAQVRARLAEGNAQVLAWRKALVEARLTLATAMGLEVERLEAAPLATDSWPPLPDSAVTAHWQEEDLLRLALSLRSDAIAARQLKESARILTAAARADLKRRMDLTFTVAYHGLHEGGSLGKTTDILDGYWEALSGYYPGPSFKVGLTLDWPFENNVARGKFAQARGLEERSFIKERDLERVIANSIEDLTTKLTESAREVESSAAAIRFYRELLEAETEKFRLGESNVVDVVKTEQDKVNAELALVSKRHIFAQLLSQLRYELGALLSYHFDEGEVVISQLRPLGYYFFDR